MCNAMLQTVVAVNAAGLRIGEDHPQAKLTNTEVELIRQLHDEGMRYEQLAQKFEVSIWTVGRICRFEMRAQTPMTYKTVPLTKHSLSLANWYKRLKSKGTQMELAL